MLRATRPATPGTGTGVGDVPASTARTSSRLLAGSVDTISTRAPPSARATAVAAAIDVLPTPPFPVKNRNGVGQASRPASGAALRVTGSATLISSSRSRRSNSLPAAAHGSPPPRAPVAGGGYRPTRPARHDPARPPPSPT